MKCNECLGRLPRLAAALAAGWSVAAPPIAVAGWNPFTHGTPIEVGPQSGQLAIADFNGDGHADILANHPLHASASLLLGDGHGGTTGRSTIDFGYDAGAMAVGDLDDDQQPDLVLASGAGSKARVHVLRGSDGGFKEMSERGFELAHDFAPGWKPSLRLIDVNGDDRLDLVAANGRQAAIDVFYGAGGGKFVPGQTVALPTELERHTQVVDDLNGDGRLDLVVASAMSEGDQPGRLTVLLGNDQGVFAEAAELTAEIPPGAQVKALADVDGDKLRDVVLTHGELATVLAQSKDGALAASVGSPFAMGHEAFGIAAIAVGYTGNDVLVAATVDSLEVVFADETGQFRHACHTPMPAGPGAYNVATGDLNGDGKLDVVANSFEGTALTVLLSNE